MRIFENINESWALVSLGEITSSILYGLNEKAASNRNGIPLIRISVARSGSVGISYLHKTTGTKFAYASYLIRFRLNQDLIIPEYLQFYLQSPMYWNYVKRVSRGATILNINSQQLSKLPVPLPSISEQKKIVEILNQAKSLREKCKKSKTIYKNLKISLFLNLFGEPSKNSKKWSTTLLGKLLLETPKDGPHESPNYVNKGNNEIPFLSTRNVKPGRLVWDDLKYISRSDAEKY